MFLNKEVKVFPYTWNKTNLHYEGHLTGEALLVEFG